MTTAIEHLREQLSLYRDGQIGRAELAEDARRVLAQMDDFTTSHLADLRGLAAHIATVAERATAEGRDDLIEHLDRLREEVASEMDDLRAADEIVQGLSETVADWLGWASPGATPPG